MVLKRHPSNGSTGTDDGKRPRIHNEELPEELERIVQQRVNAALTAATTPRVPPALQETFTPNDPVHGLMHLPAIVRTVVDTLKFQRMRHIKQLGMCPLLYPGATHDRFFHSIGTAFLAHEFVKELRMRSPELGITDRDAICVTLAGLCHDLGHPAYSHMFEEFVHGIGKDRRRRAEEAAKVNSLPAVPREEDGDIQKYEQWTHEAASVMLLREIFRDLRVPLQEAGLREDAQGDDFACIEELIDPPKSGLEKLMERQQLRTGWSTLIKGRPVEKAWLYEIISNWRSGIDVDKFDYFRRDAQYLGIQRQFDHHRYMKSVRVVLDKEGVPTISPPDKHKDLLHNMLELRKMLHKAVYQHKTTKKLECHMIDILKLMDAHVRITGVDGRELSMSEAAVLLDPVAYPKLTDTFVEARLLVHEDPALDAAVNEYEKRILLRKLMRCVGEWDLPRLNEAAPFPLPKGEAVLDGVYALYRACAAEVEPHEPVREVPLEELRTQVAKLHYGMGDKDPITRVLFHNTKSNERLGLPSDSDAKPLRHKIFVFWNPPDPSDEVTLKRLTVAFSRWAEQEVERHETHQRAMQAAPEPEPQRLRPKADAPPPRQKRTLRIQASCPMDMDLGMLQPRA